MNDDRENNIYKPKAGGIILAVILLVLVVAVILLVVFVISKDPAKKPADDTNDAQNTTTAADTDPQTDITTAEPDVGPDPVFPSGITSSELNLPLDDVYKGSLLLIDASNPYRVDESLLLSRTKMSELTDSQRLSTYNFANVSSGAVNTYKVKGYTGYYLDADALEAFKNMMSDYVKEKGNRDVQVRNAYYYDPSEEICLNATGLVVDLEINSESEGKTYPLKYASKKADYYDWFLENSHKYGFIHIGDGKNSAGTDIYSSFRFVGEGHASYIKEKGVTLEAYLQFIKNYSFDDRFIYDSSAKEWWIYYAPAVGDINKVTVIGDKYTVSGNNVDGYVVAIKASELGK